MAAKKTSKKTLEALTAAAASAFRAVRAANKGERFYFYALFTTADGSYVCPTAASEEGLERVVARYRKRDKRRTEEQLTKDLRFSAPDSEYHDADAEGFDFDGGPALHEACFQALARLDEEGFFGRGAARAKVIVNVVYGDMSDERWLDHAKRLNPKAAIDRAMPYLRLHLASGKVAQWGAKAYQVNALSLSADRKLVAYAGSGGEVGVLRVATRRPVFEKRTRGEHWACALAPDGSRLYLGDKDGIHALDPHGGATELFAKTGKPHSLAVSPDGSRVAASSFDAPLRMYDATTRKKLWERKPRDPSRLLFSPDGRWLLVVGSGRVACLDAATSRPSWEAKLGAGTDFCAAWSPDGARVLAGSSSWDFDAERGSSELAWYAAKTGKRSATFAWTEGADAVAIAPGGGRVGVCASSNVAILDGDARVLARGTGTQESLGEVAFATDDLLLSAGRDVNRGPALLALRLG